MERNRQQDEKLPYSPGLASEQVSNYNRLWSLIIIDQLIKSGAKHFYLSPGMRNAPLIYALTQAKGIQIYDVIDERAAAYRALGNAKATAMPTVLICTSGTALANYTPAIIEAQKTATPLIVISADRPTELVTHGANQSMNQVNFYGDKVKANLNLPVPNQKDSLNWVAMISSYYAQLAQQDSAGVTHINLPFHDPLDNTSEVIETEHRQQLAKILQRNKPCFENILDRRSDAVENELNAFLKRHQKVLVSIGDHSGSPLGKNQLEILNTLECPLYFDVTSGHKYQGTLVKNNVPSFDHPEVFKLWSGNKPSGILHIGGRMTSKHYYRYLQENPEIEIFQIQNSVELVNPSNSPMTKAQLNFNQIKLDELSANAWTPYTPKDYQFIAYKSKLIDQACLSFPALSKAIVENAKDNQILYIANSTLIRSFDLYSSFEAHKNIDVYSHRGVSGIEGFVAAAIGAADALARPITLAIGDVSLLHDLSSLSMLHNAKAPITIILANNKAGGIFSLLPIAKEKEVLSHMQTAHNMSFAQLAKHYGLEYAAVDSINEFKNSYNNVKLGEKSLLLEVFIDNQKNCELYDQLKTVKL